MNFLALDAATEYSGVVVVKDEQPVEWHILRARGFDVWDRIADFGEQLQGLLYHHEIEVLGYEYPSGNSSHSTNLKMGALMYQAIRTFRGYRDTGEWFNNTRMLFVKPSQVKKTGAHKDAIGVAAEMLGVRFSWSTKAEKKRIGNVADAVGIWLHFKENGYE
ncbi:MAG: hypothetical protein ACXAEN_14350 [Candidatus Thorarchaeota archaeon]